MALDDRLDLLHELHDDFYSIAQKYKVRRLTKVIDFIYVLAIYYLENNSSTLTIPECRDFIWGFEFAVKYESSLDRDIKFC